MVRVGRLIRQKGFPVKTQEIEAQLDTLSLPRWRALQQIAVSIAIMPASSPNDDAYIDWHMTYDETGERSTGVADTVNDAIDTMYQDAVRRCIIIEPRKPAHVLAWEERGERSNALMKIWTEEEWEINVLGHALRGRILHISLHNETPRFHLRAEVEDKSLIIQASYDQFLSAKDIEATTARRWQILQDAAIIGEWLELTIEDEDRTYWSSQYTQHSGSSGYTDNRRLAIDAMYFSAAIRRYLTKIPWRELAEEFPSESLFHQRAREAFAVEQDERCEEEDRDRQLAQQELRDFAHDDDYRDYEDDIFCETFDE